MRLSIQHTTYYRYEVAPKYWLQLLRLTPRAEPQQRILEWHIRTIGKKTLFKDAFNNDTHTHVVHQSYNQLSIVVEGVVELMPLSEGRLIEIPSIKTIPSLAYRVPTPLTDTSDAIVAFSKQAMPNGLKTPYDALNLACLINQTILYTSGTTDVNCTAGQAFVLGQGVCQDHAHIMIASCRSLGVAARYVSGYVDPGNSRAAASHAWVDVYLNNQWYSIDVTNGLFASDSHCRLAVGRDYLDACPIRGMREGGDSEQLEVFVNVYTTQ